MFLIRSKFKKYILIFSFISLSTNALDLSEVDTFTLKEINFDIAQGKCKTKFADEALYTAVLTAYIQDELNKYSALSKRKGVPIDVYINVDASNCGRNAWQFDIKGLKDEEEILNYSSPTYHARFLKEPMRLANKNDKSNVLGGIGLGMFIVKSLSDISADFYVRKDMTAREASAMNSAYAERAKSILKKERKNYIPENEFNFIYNALENKDQSLRIKAFDKLTKTWLYSDKLEAALRTYAKTLLLKVEEGEDDKEFRHLINAIASLGNPEAETLLRSLVKNKRIGPKLEKHIQNYIDRHTYRSQFFSYVHNTGNYNNDFSWKENQLYNRLGLDSNKEVIVALREVDDHYLNNAYLISRTAFILEEDFKVNGKKADARIDLHSWALKILEKPGNPEFLELTSYIEKNSRSEKVRKYAKSARKRLSKVKKTN